MRHRDVIMCLINQSIFRKPKQIIQYRTICITGGNEFYYVVETTRMHIFGNERNNFILYFLISINYISKRVLSHFLILRFFSHTIHIHPHIDINTFLMTIHGDLYDSEWHS